MFSSGQWAVLQKELTALAEGLMFKQRDERSLMILGLAASWASQWDVQSRDTARLFASITRKWADDLGEEHPAPEDVADQRARRCVWYLCALICHGSGELNSDDVDQLCQLALLANYTRLFEQATQHDDELRRLAVMGQLVMAHRLPELLEALEGDTGPLTAAVQLILQQTPMVLEWQPIKFESVGTGCFEAVDGDHLYSVNIQTGVVLLDGLPPSRLPVTILGNEMYKRSFGEHNFEVVAGTQRGALQTIRPISGMFYEFTESSGGLLIREMCGKHRDEGSDLELLNGCDEGVEKWGSDLPARLKKMHSHWYCRKRDLIILRPILAIAADCANSTRSVAFLIAPKEGLDQDQNIWACSRVPLHEQQVDWYSDLV
eukprot:SAG11_NODE_331_length_10659_cov_4.512689_2_plen_375_part_00